MGGDWMTAYQIDLDFDSESPEPEENPTPGQPQETTPTPPEDPNEPTRLPHVAASPTIDPTGSNIVGFQENQDSQESVKYTGLPDGESVPDHPDQDPSRHSFKSKSPLPDGAGVPDPGPDGLNNVDLASNPDAGQVPEADGLPDEQARIPWSDKGKDRAASLPPAPVPHRSSPATPQILRVATPPRVAASPDANDSPSHASPPSRLSLPDTAPSASKTPPPRPMGSPISVASSPVRCPSPRGPTRQGRAAPHVRGTQTVRAPDVDLTQGSDGDEDVARAAVEDQDDGEDERAEEPTERVLGRRYNYPLPPDLDMLPGRDTIGRPQLASEAAFWSAYGPIGSFDSFIRRIAKESDAVPALPRHMYSVGVEMALAHASIYTRHIQNARRVVAAQELASKTSRNLERVRQLQGRLQALHSAGHRHAGTPNGPAFSLSTAQGTDNGVVHPPIPQGSSSHKTTTSGPVGTSGHASMPASGRQSGPVSGRGSGQASGSGSGRASGSVSGRASGSGSGHASGSGSVRTARTASAARTTTAAASKSTAPPKRKRSQVILSDDEDESPAEKIIRRSIEAAAPRPRPPPPSIGSGWVTEMLPGPRPTRKPSATCKKPTIMGLRQDGATSGTTSEPEGTSGRASGTSGPTRGWLPNPPRVKDPRKRRPANKDYLD